MGLGQFGLKIRREVHGLSHESYIDVFHRQYEYVVGSGPNAWMDGSGPFIIDPPIHSSSI